MFRHLRCSRTVLDSHYEHPVCIIIASRGIQIQRTDCSIICLFGVTWRTAWLKIGIPLYGMSSVAVSLLCWLVYGGERDGRHSGRLGMAGA